MGRTMGARWFAGMASTPVSGTTPHATPQVTPQALVILAAAERPCCGDLQKAAGLIDREHFRTAYLEPLLAARWLDMTISGQAPQPETEVSNDRRQPVDPGKPGAGVNRGGGRNDPG
jgi:hypothetical protein